MSGPASADRATVRRVHGLVDVGDAILPVEVYLSPASSGLVIFAHGGGTSRHDAPSRSMTRALNAAGLATVQLDLLSPEELADDRRTFRFRTHLSVLADRLTATIDWASRHAGDPPAIGCLGVGASGAAALLAAVRRPAIVRAVVLRSGRPDLVRSELGRVEAPTLFIVGGHDQPARVICEDAVTRMRIDARVECIPGASHSFHEPGVLADAEDATRRWFGRHFASASPTREAGGGR